MMAVNLAMQREIQSELRQDTMRALLRVLEWARTSTPLDNEYEIVRDDSVLYCLQVIDVLLLHALTTPETQAAATAVDLFSNRNNLQCIAAFLSPQYTFEVALQAVKILCRLFVFPHLRVREREGILHVCICV